MSEHNARLIAAVRQTPVRRMTKQRLAIINMLAHSYDHPNAEAIYEAVRRDIPDISLGTVYRNLQMLVAEGLVQEIFVGHGGSRFDGNSEPHSHFFCQCCGQVFDVPPADEPSKSEPSDLPSRIPGKLLKTRTDYFGICNQCQSNKQK
jgi:Fe2+ or Zn2+ uptake regulation protein